jgi:hypothetical protein
MRRLRFLAGLAAVVLLAPAAAAQRPPAVVTGRVMILDSARAGIGVLVSVESVNTRNWTDGTGHYRLVVPATRFANGDSATMFVVRIGMRPETRRIQLTAGATIHADVGLKVQDPDPLVCEGVFPYLSGAPPRSAVDAYKLCRLPHTLRRKARGR